MHRFVKHTPNQTEAFQVWIKVQATRARKITGPFICKTRHGEVTCQDGYLALDTDGYPYPIDTATFEATYAPAGRSTLIEGAPRE